MRQVLKSYIEYICGCESVEENVMLSTRTTFRIGGPAKFFVTVDSKEQLVRLVSALKFIEEPFFIIGLGANILASDKGFDGVVIKLCFDEIVDNENFVYVDAGASLGKVVNFAKERGLSGLEWACGIPGTIGGATFMNAGAFGGSMSDVVTMVDVLQGAEVKTIDATQLDFGYRSSAFQLNRDWIILGVYLYLKKGDKKDIEKKQKEYLKKRNSIQPQEPSAGSIFKKPSEGFYVGKVVEELGLKGLSVGRAMISDKHAGFIINKGGAKSQDVEEIINIIKEKVLQKYCVVLNEEVIRI